MKRKDQKVKIKALNAIGMIFKKNSPVILTGLGIVGIASTAVFAVKATPKAVEIIEQEKARTNDDHVALTRKVALTWKLYIPAVSMGVVSAACMVGATAVNEKRNAALAGLYSLTEATLKDFQAKTVEKLGESKVEEIKAEIAQDRVNEKPVETSQVFLTEAGDTLFFDNLSGRYFKSDIEKVRRIQNDVNSDTIYSMWTSLNDFYYILGLDSIKLGEDLGWRPDHLLDISFSAIVATNGKPCIVIDYEVYPFSTMI